MIFPDVTTEEWSAKYGIDPEEVECLCGRKLLTDIPFISHDLVGFVTKECPNCLNKRPGFTSIIKSVECQNDFKDMLYGQ